MYDQPTIKTYEIIHIISKEWAKLCVRVTSNKKAIAKRG
jgi:hypothetical protein